MRSAQVMSHTNNSGPAGGGRPGLAGKGSVRTKPTSVAAKSFWGGIKKFHEKTVEEDAGISVSGDGSGGAGGAAAGSSSSLGRIGRLRRALTSRNMAKKARKATQRANDAHDEALQEKRLDTAVQREMKAAALAQVIFPQLPTKIAWDFCMMFLILYSVCSIPARIGFGIEVPMDSPLGISDLVIDGLFCIDIIFCFNLAYRDENEVLILSRRRIVVNYLTGWFTIDFLSIAPIDVAIGAILTEVNGGASSDVSAQLRSVKMIRILRLIRLLKLVRLLKLKKLTAVIDELDVNPAIFMLLKLVFQIVFVAHFLACFWYFTSEMASQEGGQGWIFMNKGGRNYVDADGTTKYARQQERGWRQSRQA